MGAHLRRVLQQERAKMPGNCGESRRGKGERPGPCRGSFCVLHAPAGKCRDIGNCDFPQCFNPSRQFHLLAACFQVGGQPKDALWCTSTFLNHAQWLFAKVSPWTIGLCCSTHCVPYFSRAGQYSSLQFIMLACHF